MRITRPLTYLRTESGRPFHILANGHAPWIRDVGICLCGRRMRVRFGSEVVDDGSVPEPVCGTCARVAKS